MQYNIYAKFDLAKMSPNVASLVTDLNETMHGFGFSEELYLESTLCLGHLNVCRDLTCPELHEITQMMRDSLLEQGLPVLSVEIE